MAPAQSFQLEALQTNRAAMSRPIGTSLPIGSIVVPFFGLYSVDPKSKGLPFIIERHRMAAA